MLVDLIVYFCLGAGGAAVAILLGVGLYWLTHRGGVTER
jgi:hypothetical protein